jgi:glycosyltransferase involved in cell wall biosynthesis
VEVILVDDDSEEVFSVQDLVFSMKVIKNERKSNSPKKDAIETAIQVAKNDWIITTDADCLVQKYWLTNFDQYYFLTFLKWYCFVVKQNLILT